MSVPPDGSRFAADFPAATSDRWRRLALGVLRKTGAAGEDTTAEAVDELLAVTTYDGIQVAPLYTRDTPVPPTGRPGGPPFTRGATATRSGWDVRQRHADPDPKATREAILADLD